MLSLAHHHYNIILKCLKHCLCVVHQPWPTCSLPDNGAYAKSGKREINKSTSIVLIPGGGVRSPKLLRCPCGTDKVLKPQEPIEQKHMFEQPRLSPVRYFRYISSVIFVYQSNEMTPAPKWFFYFDGTVQSCLSSKGKDSYVKCFLPRIRSFFRNSALVMNLHVFRHLQNIKLLE